MSNAQTLETDDLVLAPYQESDRGSFLQLVLDDAVMQHVDGPENREAAEALFNTFVSHDHPQRARTWAAQLSASLIYVGHIFITEPDGPQGVELGFILVRDHWGRGYATQAARRVLEYGHSVLGLARIAATIDVDHEASRRVVEKIGMRLETIARDEEEEPYAVYSY